MSTVDRRAVAFGPGLSEEEAALVEVAARVGARLAPTYLERAAGTDFPWDTLELLAHAGLLGITLPEELGGQGATNPVLLGHVVHELAYHDFNASLFPSIGAVLGSLLLAGRGHDDLLREVTAGKAVVALALTEPDAGSDASALVTRAVADGDGWRLTGRKTSITMVEAAQHAVVFARTLMASEDAGVSAFLVPLDGAERSTFSDLGCRPLGRGELFFDDLRLGPEALLGQPGRGLSLVLAHFDGSRILLTLSCLGAARAGIDDAVAFAEQRKVFGEPLCTKQGLTFELAADWARIEGIRALCFEALAARNRGERTSAAAAACKWLGPEVAVEALHRALLAQGHGGYELTSPTQQRMRDVIGYQLGDGSPHVQKLILARHLFQRPDLT